MPKEHLEKFVTNALIRTFEVFPFRMNKTNHPALIIATNKAIHNQIKIHFQKDFFTSHLSSSDNNNQ